MTFDTSLAASLASQENSRFARITYTNKHGETFRETIILGADYGRMLRDNYALLLTLSAPAGSIEAKAIEELTKSAEASLQGSNPLNTNVDTFEAVEVDGEAIRGLKRHTVSRELYVDGLSVKGSREVLVAGVYPTVNSRPLTIAKDAIRNTLATARYRRYKFTSFARVALNGDVLEVAEV